MHVKHAILIAAMAGGIAVPAANAAATLATASLPLNMRSGPGPQYAIVGAIPAHGQATIIGCIQGSLWCQVSFNGRQGWAFSQYLTAQLSGRSLIVAENLADIPPATYTAPIETTGSAVVETPIIAGTLVQPPAIAPPLALTPPAIVHSYVVNHPLTPVYLNGEVVEGAGIPAEVALMPVPGYDYDYAYVNSVPVLVEPTTRRVTYVYR